MTYMRMTLTIYQEPLSFTINLKLYILFWMVMAVNELANAGRVHGDEGAETWQCFR